MRLFVALKIPEAVRKNLAEVRQRFTTPQSRMRWVPSENFHVTLKFIGEVTQGKVQAVSKGLREVRTPSLVEVVFRGLGWYWNAKGFGILLATIDPSDSLTTLAKKIGRRLEPLGVAPETHEYRPHLTLARCKAFEHRLRSAIPQDLISMANEYQGHLFGSVSAQSFDLIESELDEDGSKYRTIDTFPFAGMAAA